MRDLVAHKARKKPGTVAIFPEGKLHEIGGRIGVYRDALTDRAPHRNKRKLHDRAACGFAVQIYIGNLTARLGQLLKGEVEMLIGAFFNES